MREHVMSLKQKERNPLCGPSVTKCKTTEMSMAVWYNKKHIWSLSMVPGTGLLNMLEYTNRNVFVIHNEPFLITTEFILMKWVRVPSLRMRHVIRKVKWLKGWNFQLPSLTKCSGLEIVIYTNSWTMRLGKPLGW